MNHYSEMLHKSPTISRERTLHAIINEVLSHNVMAHALAIIGYLRTSGASHHSRNLQLCSCPEIEKSEIFSQICASRYILQVNDTFSVPISQSATDEHSVQRTPAIDHRCFTTFHAAHSTKNSRLIPCLSTHPQRKPLRSVR